MTQKPKADFFFSGLLFFCWNSYSSTRHPHNLVHNTKCIPIIRVLSVICLELRSTCATGTRLLQSGTRGFYLSPPALGSSLSCFCAAACSRFQMQKCFCPLRRSSQYPSAGILQHQDGTDTIRRRVASGRALGADAMTTPQQGWDLSQVVTILCSCWGLWGGGV